MAIQDLPGVRSGTYSGACLDENMFNAFSHLNRKMNCDPVLEVSYKKAVSKGILWCGNRASGFSELMNLIGSPEPRIVEATELWQRVLTQKDYNVNAAQNVTGAPGAEVDFILAGINHADYGKKSPLQKGFELYHYRTGQTYTVVNDPDTTNNYAHSFRIVSFSNKATDIRKGDRLLVSSARTIGKVASSISPSAVLNETGYLISSSPIRVEASYCVEMATDMFGQAEIYEFDLLDDNGNPHTYWELYQKAQTRLAMDRAKTIKFILGTKIDNPNHPLYGDEFSGFDGYVNRIKYGGGNYQPIGMNGLTAANFDMVENAARGSGVTEFTWVMPHAYRVMLERNLQPLFAGSAGSCSFASFERNGTSMEDVRRLGITSFAQNGFTHHFKTADWADFPEMLGNDFLKHSTFVMPTYGVSNARGEKVATFESLKPIGKKGIDMTYIEKDDHLIERSPFSEKIEGVMREVLWLNINCINQHWMFEALSDC